jgi:hypothetical protein
MSVAEDSNARPDAPVLEGGVLAALPRARPQRASARRVAARGKAAESTAKSETAAAASAAKPAKKPKATTKPAKRAGSHTHAPAKKAGSHTHAPAKRARAGHAKPPPQPQPTPPIEPRAPRQGYEPEDELELGSTVNPPSGVELLESLTDVVSELAGSSLTAGGRLLKDALSILRRP